MPVFLTWSVRYSLLYKISRWIGDLDVDLVVIARINTRENKVNRLVTKRTHVNEITAAGSRTGGFSAFSNSSFASGDNLSTRKRETASRYEIAICYYKPTYNIKCWFNKTWFGWRKTSVSTFLLWSSERRTKSDNRTRWITWRIANKIRSSQRIWKSTTIC